jgi:hypothetical protein
VDALRHGRVSARSLRRFGKIKSDPVRNQLSAFSVTSISRRPRRPGLRAKRARGPAGRPFGPWTARLRREGRPAQAIRLRHVEGRPHEKHDRTAAAYDG